MPDSTAPLPDPASSAGAPVQAAEALAPPMPLGCLRQASAQTPAGAIIPQPTCKAKACPGNCRHKRTHNLN